MMKRAKVLEKRRNAAVAEKAALLKNVEQAHALKLSPQPFRLNRLLSCTDVSVAYEEKEVFSPVSFEICREDRICVVGKNGAGKSSLLKALLGQDIPTRGIIQKPRDLLISYVPQDIIQIIDEPTVELSGQVMKQCDVCISTGGMGMVRAAYASGKPAFGVGAGNVQCMIDTDADLEKAIPMIIEGRRFDNGIICSGEQTAIMPKSIFAKAVEIFKKNGALYIDKPEDVAKLREVVFPNGTIDKNIVGQSAKVVADRCGFAHGDDLKVILVKADTYGKDDLLSKEKMCPVIATYDNLADWDECIAAANANLNVEGKGHSVSIHSNNTADIEKAAQILLVSRFLINQVCSTNNGGSLFNSLNPTTTLGCGSWGNNSISEILSWRHLFNVSRIATVRPGAVAPTDAEIWGE